MKMVLVIFNLRRGIHVPEVGLSEDSEPTGPTGSTHLIRYHSIFSKDDASRFYIFNTLFNLPEIYVIASMIDLYESLGTSLTLCDLKNSVFPRFHP